MSASCRVGCLMVAYILATAAVVLPQPTEKLPPYKRLLQGADAKKVEELDAIIEGGKVDDYPAAVKAAEEILALRRRVQGDDHWEAIDSRWEVDALKRIAALPAAERAQARQGVAAGNQAIRLVRAGSFAEAHPLFMKALESQQKICGESHPNTAQAVNNLAYNLDQQGKFAEAEPLHRRALAIMRATLGEDHPDTAASYNNVAANLQSQGKYVDTEPLFRVALAIRQRVLGDSHGDVGAGFNNLASVLSLQGKKAEAEEAYRVALELRRQAHGEKHPETAQSYANLANLLRVQGKLDEADRLMRTALETCRQVLGDTHPYTAVCVSNLALNLDALGRLGEAQQLHEQALALRRAAFGEHSQATTHSMSLLAGNFRKQGKLDEAERLFRDIVRRHQTLGASHGATSADCINLAACLRSQGKYDDALAFWELATRTYEASRLSASGKGLDRAVFGATRSPYTGLATSLARGGKDTEAWRAFESDLARGLLDEVSARAALPLTDAEKQRREELAGKLALVERSIAALLASKGGLNANQERFAELIRERDGLQKELDVLAAELAKKEVFDLPRIQAALPPDAALVGWIDVAAAPHAVPGSDEHWACIVRRTGDPVWVKLPGSGPQGAWLDDDNAQGRQVRGLLSKALVTKAEAPAATPFNQLFTQRFGPLATALEGVKRLIILPSDALSGIPVEALLPSQTKYVVSYAPSGTMLARLRARGRGQTGQDARRLLAVGDPVLPPMAQEQSLPGSRREIEAVAGLFASADKLLGSQASRQELQRLATEQRLARYHVLHFATHGKADPAIALHSSLLLTPDGQPASGVPAGKRPRDGRLLAFDIQETWKLDAELVVLSACETGLGRLSGGEGYLGFAQPLFAAGAHSLLLSLWPVSDTASSLLMVCFYENWLGKRAELAKPQAKAEALREAKQWLRNLTTKDVEALARNPDATRGLKLELPKDEKRAPDDKPFAHPYYWSAFILIGDPE